MSKGKNYFAIKLFLGIVKLGASKVFTGRFYRPSAVISVLVQLKVIMAIQQYLTEN